MPGLGIENVRTLTREPPTVLPPSVDRNTSQEKRARSSSGEKKERLGVFCSRNVLHMTLQCAGDEPHRSNLH
jgi:hypothetical protein